MRLHYAFALLTKFIYKYHQRINQLTQTSISDSLILPILSLALSLQDLSQSINPQNSISKSTTTIIIIMYSSNPTDYQKFTASPQQSAPPPYSHPANGIPVSSTNQFYHEMPHHQPPSAPSLYGQPQSGVPVNSGNQYYSEKPQPAIQVLPKSQVPWSTGLCDCFDDVPNCCITCWCPCITFGRIAEIVDKGSTSCGASGALYALISIVVGCPCFYSCFYRSKMRQQYLLHESPCGDCLVHCCCESCALCQEYRELKNRGFDMAIGWHGNVEKQNREMGVAPVVEGGMSR